jgi:hypothetical protein
MRELKHKYIPGDHWMICDECGLRYRRSQVLERWDGFLVCKKDWEPRHPQEFVRGRVDKIAVKNPRPEQVGLELTMCYGLTWDDANLWIDDNKWKE